MKLEIYLKDFIAFGFACLPAILSFIVLWFKQSKLQKEKSELDTKMQEKNNILKSDLEATNKKLDAALQYSTHVIKAQYDFEFKIYQEIWAKMHTLLILTGGIKRLYENLDMDSEKDQGDLFYQVKNVKISYVKIKEIIENNKPFYSQTVFSKLNHFLEEVITVTENYNKQGFSLTGEFQINEKRYVGIITLHDEVCEVIRKRIAEMKIAL